MSKLVNIVKNSVGVALGAVALCSYIFGFEPQVASMRVRGEISEFTFNQYLEASRAQNGKGLLTDVVTYVAYPGAKLGRIVNNAFYKQ